MSGYGGAWQVGIREDELRTEAVSEGICVRGQLPGSALCSVLVRQALIRQAVSIGWAARARPGFECRPCHVEADKSLNLLEPQLLPLQKETK